MLLVGFLAGCSGGGAAAVAVTPPTPTPRAGSFCARLGDALPSRLDGRRRASVTPSSPRTAAWGDPAVVLRCGVPAPKGLGPTSELIDVGPGSSQVSWYLDETDDAYVFTTVGRVANVEVSVPTSVPRTEVTGPLVDLARPVLRAVPTEQEFGEGP